MKTDKQILEEILELTKKEKFQAEINLSMTERGLIIVKDAEQNAKIQQARQQFAGQVAGLNDAVEIIVEKIKELEKVS